MQKDPIGFGGGDSNLYRYVGNDPVNRIDPEGKNAVIVAAVGAVLVAVVGNIAIADLASPDSKIKKFIKKVKKACE